MQQGTTASAGSSRTTAASDFVNKRQIAERLGVGTRKASDLVKAEYWPAPIELAPRVLRWRWSEIEMALAERAPRCTERHEPEALRAARDRKAKVAAA